MFRAYLFAVTCQIIHSFSFEVAISGFICYTDVQLPHNHYKQITNSTLFVPHQDKKITNI